MPLSTNCFCAVVISNYSLFILHGKDTGGLAGREEEEITFMNRMADLGEVQGNDQDDDVDFYTWRTDKTSGMINMLQL